MRHKHVHRKRFINLGVVIFHAVKAGACDGDPAVVQEVDVFRQIFNRSCVEQAEVVVAGEEDFVDVWQGYQPVKKVQNLRFGAIFGNVTGMYQQLRFRKRSKPVMHAVRIGDVKDGHFTGICPRCSSGIHYFVPVSCTIYPKGIKVKVISQIFFFQYVLLYLFYLYLRNSI